MRWGTVDWGRHGGRVVGMIFRKNIRGQVNHLHQKARALVGLGKDFVIHSLRHTMLTRLGESGVDAFTIMRIAGHNRITVSQRYVHPSPEAVERAFERLQLSGIQGQIEPKCCYRLQKSLQSAEARS